MQRARQMSQPGYLLRGARTVFLELGTHKEQEVLIKQICCCTPAAKVPSSLQGAAFAENPSTLLELQNNMPNCSQKML